MNGQDENIDISSVNDYAPTSAKSFQEYVSGKSGVDRLESNYGVIGNIDNFFTGKRDQNEKNYDAYLQNLNTENAWKLNELNWQRELQATQSAREWDKMMSDTQYQRMAADLKAAGLNPWLALQSGVSGSSVPSSSKANVTSGKSSNYSRSSNEKKSGARDLSLLLFALARLAAI